VIQLRRKGHLWELDDSRVNIMVGKEDIGTEDHLIQIDLNSVYNQQSSSEQFV